MNARPRRTKVSFLPSCDAVTLPKETVGRVRAVLIEMLTNDNKEDEDIEDDDKEDDDVHQLITQQRRRMKS